MLAIPSLRDIYTQLEQPAYQLGKQIRTLTRDLLQIIEENEIADIHSAYVLVCLIRST